MAIKPLLQWQRGQAGHRGKEVHIADKQARPSLWAVMPTATSPSFLQWEGIDADVVHVKICVLGQTFCPFHYPTPGAGTQGQALRPGS